MEIKRLTITDLDQYFALRLDMLKDSPDAFLITYDEEKARGKDFAAGILQKMLDDNALFGAVLDGQLVGAAGVYRSDGRVKTAHRATLWGMFVQPGARGKGVGEALVAAVIGHAKGPMKAQALYLCVEGRNTKAQALYERMGFRVWGKDPMGFKIGDEIRADHHLLLDLRH